VLARRGKAPVARASPKNLSLLLPARALRVLLHRIVVFSRRWGLPARLVAGTVALPVRLRLMRFMLEIFRLEMFRHDLSP